MNIYSFLSFPRQRESRRLNEPRVAGQHLVLSAAQII